MNILVIGQCTLHWGRMEFGNIGNFYIMEPFFELIHEMFPDSTVKTTFQMSDDFCKKAKIEVLPMSLYYNWDNDLKKSEDELKLALEYNETGKLTSTTKYIELVKTCDLVIDFSGDIWGKNANFLGEDRFYVGLIKDRVAQIFAKKTVMLAGSPGPFENDSTLAFAKEVYKNFDLVTNRESISTDILNQFGFNLSKTKSLACPAFLFKPSELNSIKKFDHINQIIKSDRKSIGFLICGWNFKEGPFDKWPRKDSDYEIFVEAIVEFLESNRELDFYLMSHSNGFPIPPAEFKLIHGRDFPIMKQLFKLLKSTSVKNQVFLLEEIYDAWQSKAILGQFDMVISGRVHAAVAAMSQCVPTVIIDYGHEPKAHKLKGFAQVARQEQYLAAPEQKNNLAFKMNTVWNNRMDVKAKLEDRIPEVKNLGRENFEILKALF